MGKFKSYFSIAYMAHLDDGSGKRAQMPMRRSRLALLALMLVAPNWLANSRATEREHVQQGSGALVAEATPGWKQAPIPLDMLVLERKIRLAYSEGNQQAALADLDQLVAWVKANLPPHHQFRALGLSWQGLILNAAGRSQEALGPTLEALKIAHHLANTTSTCRGEPTNVAAFHRGQAESDQLLRQLIEQLPSIQLEAARNSLQKALRAYQQTDYRAGEPSVLAYLGMTFEASNYYMEANDYFRRSLAIARHLQNKLTRHCTRRPRKIMSTTRRLLNCTRSGVVTSAA